MFIIRLFFMDLERIKKVHFIGVGGIGLSAIARLMKEKGKAVSGSDLSSSLVTEKLEKIGINIFIGQSEENITKDIDLVIHTMAIPENNPELKEAKKVGIKTLTYPEFLGLVVNEKFGIAICGTHGKSSTTAMAGLLLDDAGIDPTILVGSIVPKYDSNLRIGKSEYMIIEACEYERAFLNYYPKIIIINNIELDHTDYYRDISDFRSAFEEFAGHLPKDGILIANGDDREIEKLKIKIKNDISKLKIINFGLGDKNDVRGYEVITGEGQTKFKVNYKGQDLGEFVLKVPGIFNVYNALAAISLGLVLNLSTEKIKKSLAGYSGIWRRFEIKGGYKGALVVSDYAHHPTPVKATIKAEKKFYPRRRIFAVFQPHQHNRTKKLYGDFLESFDSADIVILSEIFDVAGREEKKDQDVSSRKMAEDIKKRSGNYEIGKLNSESIFYAKDLSETQKLIDEKLKPNDVLLVMGAGDIYKIADNLMK